MKQNNTHGRCVFCANVGNLMMSHSIPEAAFRAALKASNGKMIGIPYGDGNVHYTSDSGAAPMLCASCEGNFNRKYDGPLSNALKSLENAILDHGPGSAIDFPANQFAHAIVSIAWRICRSNAHLYSEVILRPDHSKELDRIFRLSNEEILKNCSIILNRLTDFTKEGGFQNETMNQFIKIPEVKLQKNSQNFCRFMISWTMFGFKVSLIVPKLHFSMKRQKIILRRNSKKLHALPVNIIDDSQIMKALIAGYAAHVEGRLTPALLKRHN